MGDVPDKSVPDEMYENRTEEMLCILADSNGVSIQLVDTEERRYWLEPGVTHWSFETLREWVEELLREGSTREYGIDRLHKGPLEVTIYDEVEYYSER